MGNWFAYTICIFYLPFTDRIDGDWSGRLPYSQADTASLVSVSRARFCGTSEHDNRHFGFMNSIKERMFMCIKDVMVQNQVGLHARPATFFIQKANEFRSAIWIEKEERRVNAKSLLGILSLGIVGGTAIRIIADGTDEEQAVAALVELVDSGFSDETR